MSDGTPENHESNPNEEKISVDVVKVEQVSNELAESTTANGDNIINKRTDSGLAKGLSSIISSVIRDFDSRAEETIRSQDQLSFSIDRLTRGVSGDFKDSSSFRNYVTESVPQKELDQLLEDAPLPFIMQHAAKISGVRKRVSTLNLVLKSIQSRVDNIDQMVSAGLSHEKMTE